jgi:hypothetical protein
LIVVTKSSTAGFEGFSILSAKGTLLSELEHPESKEIVISETEIEAISLGFKDIGIIVQKYLI